MLPSRLYKYRADTEYTTKIITDRQIWLSTASNLNDPLECRTGIIPEDWKQEIILKKEQAQLAGMLYDFPLRPVKTLFSLNSRQTKQWLKSLAKLPHAQKVKRMRNLYLDHGIKLSDPSKMFEGLEAQLASVGIFSLSAAGNQQLMWAHYGDSHKGLAFGFAFSDSDPLADPEHFLEVVYADQKPVFSGGYFDEVRVFAGRDGVRSEGRVAFNDPVFRASISTKPLDWAYEQEWRYVHEIAGAHPLPGRLASVTFGLRMPVERKAFYTRLLEDNRHSVELLEIRQDATGSLILEKAVIL